MGLTKGWSIGEATGVVAGGVGAGGGVRCCCGAAGAFGSLAGGGVVDCVVVVTGAVETGADGAGANSRLVRGIVRTALA